MGNNGLVLMVAVLTDFNMICDFQRKELETDFNTSALMCVSHINKPFFVINEGDIFA